MSRLALAGLVGLAGLLSLVLVQEIRGGAPAGLAPEPPRPAALGGTPPPADAPAPQLASVILERPLFAKNRRPPPGVAGPTTGPRALPRIAGIVITRDSRRVIFAAEADAKPVIAQEGEQVGAHTIMSIRAGEVVLLGPQGRVVLHPSYASDKDAAPSPAVRTQPAAAAAAVQGGSILDRFGKEPPPVIPLPPPPTLDSLMARPRKTGP